MKFSIVFQEGALFDSMNVKENVAFCLREYSRLTEEEIDQRVREILRIVDVEAAIDLAPEELSGGMHRRVAIARAAACGRRCSYMTNAGLDRKCGNICKLIVDLAKRKGTDRTQGNGLKGS
jgi:phospholipid/cholesterol/gamma-HCH transport system ATP-binding protein